MPRPHYHLRRQILRRPTKRIRDLIPQQLRQPKVSQLYIPIITYQDILRFEIPIEHAALMQVPKGESDLSSVKLGSLLGEALDVLQVLEELAACDEIHEEVDSVV